MHETRPVRASEEFITRAITLKLAAVCLFRPRL